MKKIRGFKLNLRIKEVQRRAKKGKLDLAALSLDTDPALTALLDAFSARAKPSVLFESYPAEGTKRKSAAIPSSDAAAPVEPIALSPLPGLAYTLVLATLGPDVDAFVEERLKENPALAGVFDVAAEVALEDATRFVLSLIEEEAKLENCELSPIQNLTDL